MEIVYTLQRSRNNNVYNTIIYYIYYTIDRVFPPASLQPNRKTMYSTNASRQTYHNIVFTSSHRLYTYSVGLAMTEEILLFLYSKKVFTRRKEFKSHRPTF